MLQMYIYFFFFQAEDGIRDYKVTGVQTCALPILAVARLDRLPDRRRDRNGRDVEGVRRARTHRLGDADEAAADGLGAGRKLRRSGERRVGEEGRSRWAADHLKKKKKKQRERCKCT